MLDKYAMTPLDQRHNFIRQRVEEALGATAFQVAECYDEALDYEADQYAKISHALGSVVEALHRLESHLG